MHFSRSITQYGSHGRFHREIRPFSRRLFSLCSSKSTKIVLFCYLKWFLRFAMAQGRSFRIETFKIIVALILRITKWVTHNKVMNFHDFLDYMMKSSKCGPHASKLKSWILYRLRSTQKYPHFEDFFYRPKMAEILYLLSHLNAMCDNICVKPDEGYNLLGAFKSALCRSNHFVFSKWLFLKGIWL